MGSAGNDLTQAGRGPNRGAGEARGLSSGGKPGETGKTQPPASGAGAGNDVIATGAGDDTVSGGAQAKGATATATQTNDATLAGAAGNDVITAGEGNNLVAGDAQAIGDAATAVEIGRAHV